MNIESAAFILHRQNYGETSRILRCFTRDFGRVDLICKGCRRAGKQARVLEPFRLYTLSWFGKSELKTLRQADEVNQYALLAQSEKLYCGFYMNELLSQVNRMGEAEPALFDHYEKTLCLISQCQKSDMQVILRSFELVLLREMGYGLSLDFERDGLTAIEPALSYGFEPEQGFYQSTGESGFLARGDSIIALRQGRFENKRQEREARSLMRFIISYYLPNTSIQSRKLFA